MGFPNINKPTFVQLRGKEGLREKPMLSLGRGELPLLQRNTPPETHRGSAKPLNQQRKGRPTLGVLGRKFPGAEKRWSALPISGVNLTFWPQYVKSGLKWMQWRRFARGSLDEFFKTGTCSERERKGIEWMEGSCKGETLGRCDAFPGSANLSPSLQRCCYSPVHLGGGVFIHSISVSSAIQDLVAISGGYLDQQCRES